MVEVVLAKTSLRGDDDRRCHEKQKFSAQSLEEATGTSQVKSISTSS